MLRRRWPSPTLFWRKIPQPSGPRSTSGLNNCWRITGDADPPKTISPQSPHISYVVPLAIRARDNAPVIAPFRAATPESNSRDDLRAGNRILTTHKRRVEQKGGLRRSIG